MYGIKGFIFAFSVLVSLSISANPKYQEFADMMQKKHGFEPKFVLDTLSDANKDEEILKKIATPWEAKPWHQYYPIFLTDKRLTSGLKFWKEHADTLVRAEQETGVPAEIIVAIIGVETFYGTYLGKYPVLDALYTLGFYYPPRAKFFKSELEQYFLLTREEQFDMTKLKGSYAGAMGWGQFISSSYRHYAVDFDQDGIRDLLTNPVDAIGSVANYFKKHGWKKDQGVAYPALVTGNKYSSVLSKTLKYSTTWDELQKSDVKLQTNLEIAPQTSAKLFEFQQAEDKEYWVGLKNFYVITRYNHSPLYAMAVFQFSQQLAEAMD
jgi:membrane-bound lytic murein transglycosylase B